MHQPDDFKEDGTPVFDAIQWERPMELQHALMAGTMPLPCWIRIGRTAMRINTEDVQAVCRGILLSSLMRAE